MLLDKIEELLKEVSTLTAQNAGDVEQLRLKYLSKKGEISALMGEFRNVAADQKKAVGMKINELKQLAQNRINELKDQLETCEAQSDDIDLTRTAYPISLGTRHPLTLVKNEIIDIFARMGFTLYQGPEIDDDQHVFTMLNFAADHPARDMQDTFFIERSNTMDVTKNVLLRSHTSNDEAHYMSTHKPPIRVLCPGRVYREMFGAGTKIRLRPSYFPFTEPSAEMDISCNICGGEGCGFCKHTGWVEILGCGMVDPHDLEACGIDSSVYTGYAFGMGVERIANLKYRVSDLRLFSENDTRFLREFEGA